MCVETPDRGLRQCFPTRLQITSWHTAHFLKVVIHLRNEPKEIVLYCCSHFPSKSEAYYFACICKWVGCGNELLQIMLFFLYKYYIYLYIYVSIVSIAVMSRSISCAFHFFNICDYEFYVRFMVAIETDFPHNFFNV